VTDSPLTPIVSNAEHDPHERRKLHRRFYSDRWLNLPHFDPEAPGEEPV